MKETGIYNRHQRTGEWKYFYDSGKPEKLLNFTDSGILIMTYYDPEGNLLVKDGTGTYAGEFYRNWVGNRFSISGPVKNGKMDGIWNFANVSYEVYDNGRFVSGKDINTRFRYNSNPKILITDFCLNEQIKIHEGNICSSNVALPLSMYDGYVLHKFYPAVIKTMQGFGKLKNQWLIVSMEFDEKFKQKNINIYSSINDKGLEDLLYAYMSKMKGDFRSPVRGKVTLSQRGKVLTQPLLFTIDINNNFTNEPVIIPKNTATGSIYN